LHYLNCLIFKELKGAPHHTPSKLRIFETDHVLNLKGTQ
jgi:hypothetical protein